LFSHISVVISHLISSSPDQLIFTFASITAWLDFQFLSKLPPAELLHALIHTKIHLFELEVIFSQMKLDEDLSQ